MKQRLIPAAVAAAAVLVMLSAAGLGFVSFDDTALVTENPFVTAGLTPQGLAHAFTAATDQNWAPLAFTSHMLDVELYGLSPAGHHATSIVLHALAAALACIAFTRLLSSSWAGAFVALAFAVHPQRVESVAWIAERRDVLYAVFTLGGLLAYLHYAERRTPLRYVGVLALHACALMSKSMAVTTPLLLLVVDLCFLDDGGRPPQKRLVLEKAPLLAMSAAAAVVTLAVQTPAAIAALPLGRRLVTALVAVARYVELTAAPHGLCALYPMPAHWPAIDVVTSAVVVLGLGALLVKGSREVRGGVLWFLVALLPVLGVVHVGRQAFADRYTYLASLGLLVVVAVAARALLARRPGAKTALVVAAASWLAALSVLTVRQIGFWSSSEALFARALDVTEDNDLAEAGVGNARYVQGDFAGALPHLERAAALLPTAQNLDRLGRGLFRVGRFAEAKERFLDSLTVDATAAETHVDLGAALVELGETGAGMLEVAQGLKLAPGDPRVRRRAVEVQARAMAKTQ